MYKRQVLILSLVSELTGRRVYVVSVDGGGTDFSVDNIVLSSVAVSVDFLTSVASEKPLPSSVVKLTKLDDAVPADPDPSCNDGTSSNSTCNSVSLSSYMGIEDRRVESLNIMSELMLPLVIRSLTKGDSDCVASDPDPSISLVNLDTP